MATQEYKGAFTWARLYVNIMMDQWRFLTKEKYTWYTFVFFVNFNQG